MISAKFVPLKYYTLSSQLQRLTSFSVLCSGRRILSPGQIAVMQKWSIPHKVNMRKLKTNKQTHKQTKQKNAVTIIQFSYLCVQDCERLFVTKFVTVKYNLSYRRLNDSKTSCKSCHFEISPCVC